MSGVVEAIAFKTTRYKCPFCSRSYSRRTPANRHIDRCWRNPAVRGCKSCAWHIIHDAEPEVGLPADEFCNAPKHHDLSNGLRTNCDDYRPAVNPNQMKGEKEDE